MGSPVPGTRVGTEEVQGNGAKVKGCCRDIKPTQGWSSRPGEREVLVSEPSGRHSGAGMGADNAERRDPAQPRALNGPGEGKAVDTRPRGRWTGWEYGDVIPMKQEGKRDPELYPNHLTESSQ